MKKRKMNLVSKIILIVLCVAAAAALVTFGVELAVELNANKVTDEISTDKAESLIRDTVDKMPISTAVGAKYLLENTEIKAESVKYGMERDVTVLCNYKTLNVGKVISENTDKVLGEINDYYDTAVAKGKKVSATQLQTGFEDRVVDLVKTADTVEGQVEVKIYQMSDGSYSVYCEDKTIDTLLGGLVSAVNEINEKKSISYGDKTVDISNKTTIRSAFVNIIALNNYESSKPVTGGKVINALNTVVNEFRKNFIANNMWKYLVSGTLTTLEITGLSVMLGIFLGVIVAIVRVSHDANHSMPILNAICKTYLSVIRGTPVMVQMLIIYFIILAPLNINKFPAAVLCFGINSGAYVSEIIRGGIMSVDAGQMEAGRSLGLNYAQTMTRIVIPQAFKTSLPSLANEFIALLKETSVAFYIGVSDLNQAGLRIRSITHSNFMPLIAVALIYLAIVMLLTKLVGLLEKALRKSERKGLNENG